VVGTDLESLVPPHDEPDFLAFLVLEKSDITSSSFLPLEVGLVESEELGSPGCQLCVVRARRYSG
jgi:hypothetical protein